MRIYTIGFTRKNAEQFFGALRRSGAKRLVDVRLNNVSQLAGFTKRQDLAFFLDAICGMEYVHAPELAPTAAMLAAYRKEKGDWSAYERRFLSLLEDRRIEETIPPALVEDACLLCSEATPHHCHRRLVAEYLQRAWGGVEVHHL